MQTARKPQFNHGTWAEHMPEIHVPAATMIGSAWRFSNIYAPAPETILLEQELLPAQPATIRIEHRHSKSLSQHRNAGRRAAMRHALESTVDGRVNKLNERLVYDARWLFNGNLAHLMGGHVTSLGFAKRKAGVGRGDVLVLLEKKSPKISHDLFKLLGFETYETNRAVQANVLDVDYKRDLAPYHLIPNIATLEPAGLKPSTVEKIFISRRVSRRITNEKEITAITTEQGYETVYFEDIPLAAQWSLVRDARSIVSIHGAALGYLSTKPQSGASANYKLLEIFSPGLVCDCYRKTTAVVGGQWVGCRGAITSDFVKHVEEGKNIKARDGADFYLDPNALERAFAHLNQLPQQAAARALAAA